MRKQFTDEDYKSLIIEVGELNNQFGNRLNTILDDKFPLLMLIDKYNIASDIKDHLGESGNILNDYLDWLDDVLNDPYY